jgi:two-component system, NarL family, sensor histidine kinase UhpB
MRTLKIFGKTVAIIIAQFCFYTQSSAQYPKTLDSLKIFLKTQPQDTTYVLALSDYAKMIIQAGKKAEADSLINKLQFISTKLNYGVGIYKVTYLKSFVEYLKQKPKKILEYIFEGIAIIDKYKLPKKYYQNSLNTLVITYGQFGDRDNATKYSMQLIEFQRVNNLKPYIGFPYHQIGDNLAFYKKYDQALKYYEKYLEIETKNNNLVNISVAENALGINYNLMKKYSEAMKHLQRALGIAEKVDYQLLQGDILINIGKIYKQKGDLIKTEQILKKCELINRKADATVAIGRICQELGDLYLLQKKYALAEQYYLETLLRAKQADDPVNLFAILQVLAKFYGETNDYKKAYQYKLEAEIAKDSSFKIETNKNTENLLRKYEAKEKEQEITLLNEKNEKSSFQNKSLIAGGLLLFLLTGVSAVFFVNRTKLKRLEESQKLRNRIAADLHDEIGSTLSSILLISGMAKKTDNVEKNSKMFTKIHTDSQHVMESVDEIIWSVNPVNDSLQGIMLRLREYAQPLAESKNIAFEFKADEAIENLNLPMEIRRNLYLIVKEAINNLIKYSEATKASVYFQQDKKGIVVTIKDNGKGFDTEMITTRNGLKNMQIRAKEIHGKMVIESKIGHGAEIVLSFEL